MLKIAAETVFCAVRCVSLCDMIIQKEYQQNTARFVLKLGEK